MLSLLTETKERDIKMGKNLLGDLRDIIGSLGFKIFLWSVRMTEDQYLKEIEKDAFLTGFNRGIEERGLK